MGDNLEQEAADLAAMNNDDDDDNLFEVIYRGGRLSDNNVYTIPDDVNIRLIIHASVTEIARYACYDCTALIEVVFHNNVTTIGPFAFDGCSNLLFVVLHEGLLRLEHDAFYGCKSLRGEIVIPASVQYMGDAVFRGCTSLESVVFVPTTNVRLGIGIFRGCSILRVVTLPHNLRSIPARFFMGCILLTRLQIPVSVHDIGADSFSGSGLQLIEIPKHVHQIRREAFRNCAFLERVTIHASNNLTMAGNIFANCPLLSVIQMYPWLWPTLFASMQEHPEFIFIFI